MFKSKRQKNIAGLPGYHIITDGKLNKNAYNLALTLKPGFINKGA